MLDIVANLLTLTLSILFPVYASYKALQASDPALLTPWLTYWLVLALVNSSLSILSFILPYLPFYAWIRLGLHVYLLLPGQQQGASYLYRTHVLPVLVDHDAQIEQLISTAHDRAKALGLEYWDRLLEYLKTQVFGEKHNGNAATTHAANAPTASTRSGATLSEAPAENYTQKLLSRFSTPSARPIAPVLPSDLAAVLSSALEATVGGKIPALPSGAQDDKQAAQSLLQHLTMPSLLGDPTERLTRLTTQTERLRTLLGIFDKHAEELAASQELDPLVSTATAAHIEQMPGTLADSQILAEETDGQMKKSKSEADFEAIEHIEVPVTPDGNKTMVEAKVAGGWGPWIWGRKGSSVAVVRPVVEPVPSK